MRNVGTALRFFRVMALVALVFFLLVQVPTPNPRSAISGSPPVTRVISFRTDASPEAIQAAGAELLESYGAFAVARGGAGRTAPPQGPGAGPTAPPGRSPRHPPARR